MDERICIFIDGANFYHLVLKKMGLRELDFDFEAFTSLLANGRSIVERGKRFYIGTVRERAGDPRSVEAMSRQTSLFTLLTNAKWEVKTSKLRQRRERLIIDNRVEESEKIRGLGINEIRFVRDREKGIDVKLVTDLFVGAIDNKYDTAVVVSSDTDLVPAIDSVRNRLNRKVEYIGFSIKNPDDPDDNTRPIVSMIQRTDIQRTFVASDLKPFIKPTLLTLSESRDSK